MLDGVYIAYWSLRDPLFQSQSLPVVRALARSGRRMAILTFEQPPWRLARSAELALRQGLAGEGIEWQPLVYHKRPRGLSTLLDVLLGLAVTLRLSLTRGVRLFHGRGTVPCAIARLAARLSRARFFNDADGPLSQEYVDARLWRAGSPLHSITRRSERRCLRDADAVAVLTERRRREVVPEARSPVDVLPCGVDLERFAPGGEPGRLRGELGLTGRVLVYAGKTGGWYLTEPMLDFAAAFNRVVGGASLLVLTNEDPGAFLVPAAARGLPCVVRQAAPEEMPRYLSAADAGLSFRIDAPSQAACSPIKNGEYLASGLPIVTTAGVGDYSALVEARRVGVVVAGLAAEPLHEAALDLERLLRDTDLPRRCRDTARDTVGLREVVLPRYLDIYRRLLGDPTGA